MSDSKSQSFDSYLDEISPLWENFKSVITKHPKDTFKFIQSDKGEWLLEINFDLLGLPKETTMSSLYKE